MSTNLLIRIPTIGKQYAIRFDKDTTISNVCKRICDKIPEARTPNPSDYGIFIPDPDPKHSYWLDNARMLSYYHFHDNYEVEYRCKLRFVTIQTMDGTKKKLQVDDSKTITELLITVCGKMGITNHEEYSLILPLDEAERMRTLTLKKSKTAARDQDKLEKMKQKLHTDDELNWLNHGKTLRQHEIEETDVLLLRRKYFFSDQNVDTRDPVQLNLLFIQLREAILNGTHPISYDQAINLAALQCHAEIGTLTAEKIKNNPVDLKSHLPKEYAKSKGTEKRVVEQHRKLGDFDQNEAKMRYIQLCRSLPTYGITFFLIKEKQKGRNKLIPRLFGISKESVMRVDEKTKEILETWPLSRIRRWAAGSTFFTLDFGEHNPDGNYAVQTTEAEQIGQLISGYVDIILRRQQNKKSSMDDADEEENVIVEDNVISSKANVISNLNSTLNRGQSKHPDNVAGFGMLHTANYRGDFNEGHIALRGHAITEQDVGGSLGSGRMLSRNGYSSRGDSLSDFQVIDAEKPKRALLTRIDNGLQTIYEASEDLEKPIYNDDAALRGDDAITRRWRAETLEQARAGVMSHLGAMTMATGNLVESLQTDHMNDREDGPPVYDYSSMDASLASIGMNVHGLMQCVRLYDQIDSANGTPANTRLKEAAQELSVAFQALMKATVPLSPTEKDSSLNHSLSSLTEIKPGPDRAALLEAAGRVGDASRHLLQLISQPFEGNQNNACDLTRLDGQRAVTSVVDWETRDKFLSATKLVTNDMAKLVKFAKSGAVALSQEAAALNSIGEHGESETEEAANILRTTQHRLISSATAAGKSASRLVACAKVVVCTMEQPESQQQLISAAKDVGMAASSVPASTDYLIQASEDIACWDQGMRELHMRLCDDLRQSVAAVHSDLDSLLQCLRSASIQAHHDPVVTSLLSASNQLPASVGDGKNLVNRASSLASAASKLMEDLRAEAMRGNIAGLSLAEAEKRAELLEGEIHQLITSAQECADGNIQSLEHQQQVVAAAEQLISMIYVTAAPIIRARLTRGLEFATRLTASNVGPLVTVGGEAVRICQGNTYRLATDLEQLQKRIMPQVSQSCIEAREEPYNAKKQGNLLMASQNLMQCLEDLLRSADAVVPTISDSGIQTAFSGATRNTQACLTDLRLCYDNSEHILSQEPPKMDLYTQNSTNAESTKILEEQRAACVKTAKDKLDKLERELQENRYQLLPDDTLDSICASLWHSVTRFNFSFSNTERTSIINTEDVHACHPMITLLLKPELGTKSASDQFSHTMDLVDDLLDCLMHLIHGIQGLIAFLACAGSSEELDPNLSRVLLVSHGLAAMRQSNLSGRSSPIDTVSIGLGATHSQEDQAKAIADDMLHNLLSIGEGCLNDASQLIIWAVQNSGTAQKPSDSSIERSNLMAEQLATSVNAVLGYVPGEVIVRRFRALLNDTSRMLSDNSTMQNNTITRRNKHGALPPALPPRQVFDRESTQNIHSKLVFAARRLVKVSSDGSVQCSNNHQTERQKKARSIDQLIGSDSEVIRLAQLADRITSALVDVLRLVGIRGSTNEAFVEILDSLYDIGLPVAQGLRHAMRSLPDGAHRFMKGYSESAPSMPLTQAMLNLREWALKLGELADAQAANLQSSSNDMNRESWASSTNVTDAIVQMRNQCETSLRRVHTLLLYRESSNEGIDEPVSGSGSVTFCPNRVPVYNQTYVDCVNKVIDLKQNMESYTQSIPSAAVNQDAQSFITAVKEITQSVSYLWQMANQSAYLVSAAHPASKPGQVSRFNRNGDQLTALHENIAAVRKGASELSHFQMNATPDGLPPLEVLNIATHVAERATHLCQSTKPLLSDCKNATERKAMAESLQRVANAAKSVFDVVNSSPHAPESATQGIFTNLKQHAAQLEEAVDHYSGLLLKDAGGTPSHVTEEALELQKPLFECGQSIVRDTCTVLEQVQQLIRTKTDDCKSVEQDYWSARQDVMGSLARFSNLLSEHAPGLSACNTIQKVIVRLLTELDNSLVLINSDSGKPFKTSAATLESSLVLVRSNIQQIEHQCTESVLNWNQGHWELMAHNVYGIESYLPHLLTECTRITTGLARVPEQTRLLNYTRTVLEAIQQLIDHLSKSIQNYGKMTSPLISPSNPPIDLLVQACKDLFEQIDVIATHQGGLTWHISSITAACTKLDDLFTAQNGASLSPNQLTSGREPVYRTEISLPVNFVKLHSRLGNESRVLLDTAVRHTEICANISDSFSVTTGNNSIAGSVASLSQQFIQISETVHQMASVLNSQTQPDRNGPSLARRLCQITQSVGAACSDFIREPLDTTRSNNLSTRLDDMKAALQSCSRGADACIAAANGIIRLKADLDTAALFARAGTNSPPQSPLGKVDSPAHRSSNPLDRSSESMIILKQRAFQSAQERVKHAAKEIVEDMRSLVNNTSTDQDALAVSAQNSLLRTTELTEAIKEFAACAVSIYSLMDTIDNDAFTESQVQLFLAARDITDRLINLLNQGKAVAATSYALEAWGDEDGKMQILLTDHQHALSDTTEQVVRCISLLSRHLRSLNDLISSGKPTPAAVESSGKSPSTGLSSVTPPPVPPKRISLLSSGSSSSDKNTAESAVCVGLETVASVLSAFEQRLECWSIRDGALIVSAVESDLDLIKQNGHILNENGDSVHSCDRPSHLISAAQAITHSASKADEATKTGKLSEMAMAGDLLRRAAEELVHRLRIVSQTALEQASQSSDSADEKSRQGSFESTNGQLCSTEEACRCAVTGTLSTILEMKQMVEHMIKSLGSGSTTDSKMQVTLTKRRLRETVFQIEESASKMPGAKDDPDAQQLSHTTTIQPRPIPITLRNKEASGKNDARSNRPVSQNQPYRSTILLADPKNLNQVEQSIAEAISTASDAGGSTELQGRLQNCAVQLERNVNLIGEIHSRYALKRNAMRNSIQSPTFNAQNSTPNTENNNEPASILLAPIVNMDKAESDETSAIITDMDEVLAACQAVLHNTQSLMHWAAAAQRELVQQGRLKPVDLNPNGSESETEAVWAQGLISAADYAAAAANHLVESAQAMVTVRVNPTACSNFNKATGLVGAAKMTAVNTAHLVIACMAKADSTSVSARGLRYAGSGVKRAVEHLVNVVQRFNANTGEHSLDAADMNQAIDGPSKSVVGSVKKMIETQSTIAAKQKELDDLHEQLKGINRDQYRHNAIN